MKVAVYALTTGAAGRLPARGLSAEGLRLLRVGSISAIVGHVRTAAAPTEPNLRRYAALIGRLASGRTSLLPVRFGTVMHDEAELVTVLRARQQAIRTQLAHVRGRVQMTVRVVTKGEREKGERENTGAEYLTARAREQRSGSIPEFVPLHQAVARWVRDERVERQGTVATVYHLVPAGSAEKYANALEQAAMAAGVQGFVSGPWPPHAFADSW